MTLQTLQSAVRALVGSLSAEIKFDDEAKAAQGSIIAGSEMKEFAAARRHIDDRTYFGRGLVRDVAIANRKKPAVELHYNRTPVVPVSVNVKMWLV